MTLNQISRDVSSDLSMSIAVPQEWVSFETGDGEDIMAFSSGEADEISQVAILLCRNHGKTPVKTAKAYALGYALALEGYLSQFALRRAFGYNDFYRIGYRWEGEGKGTRVECVVALTRGQVIVGEVRFEDGSEGMWSSVIEEMFSGFSVDVNQGDTKSIPGERR